MYKHFPLESWGEAVSEVERISSMVSGMALREQHVAAAMSHFALSRHLFLVFIFNFLKLLLHMSCQCLSPSTDVKGQVTMWEVRATLRLGGYCQKLPSLMSQLLKSQTAYFFWMVCLMDWSGSEGLYFASINFSINIPKYICLCFLTVSSFRLDFFMISMVPLFYWILRYCIYILKKGNCFGSFFNFGYYIKKQNILLWCVFEKLLK